MKPHMLVIALLASSSLAAPFTASQLTKLTQTPQSFKPSSTGEGENVNANTPTVGWAWGNTLSLSRLSRNFKGWRLSFHQPYTLSQLAPGRRRLYELNDDLMDEVTQGSLITAGPFKGNYAELVRYSDGSESFSILSAPYALAGGKGSELTQGGVAQMQSYPTFGYIQYRSQFCSTPGVQCF